MMSGIGENLLCELIAKVAFKAVRIAYHIATDSINFRDDRHNFQVRLNIQIARLEEVQKVLSNPILNEDIQPRDRHTYFNVMQNLHRLLFNYYIATEPETYAAVQFVKENSADDIFNEIALRDDPALVDPSIAQEKFWLRKKEQLTWALFRKEKLEKLVAGVEFWGNCLDTLISTTIPLIFLRKHLTAAEIAKNTPGDKLVDTNIKSQILIERRVEEEAVASSMSGLKITRRDTGSADLNYSHLRFLSPHVSSAKNIKDGDEKDEGRTDLGGASRRQWAQLLDDQGHVKESRIIVEFKERPQIREFSQDNVDSVKKELRSLARELRLGARGTAFHVLYCHGFYENTDHYGLVYQLPQSITADEYLQCESLGNILMNTEYKLMLGNDLQNRLELAKSLATTMYHLHSVQWVHKSFNPDNILLFGQKRGNGTVEFDWSRPYLVGFDASRSNRAHSDKLPSSLRWENRVYTHPARQREGELPRFHKIFDIYSLGVVLLEIGMLDCFKHSAYRRNVKWTDIPAGEVQNQFIVCAKDLKRSLGRTYAEIVKVCLDGKFGVSPDEDDADETHLLEAFWSEVCEKFDQVRY